MKPPNVHSFISNCTSAYFLSCLWRWQCILSVLYRCQWQQQQRSYLCWGLERQQWHTGERNGGGGDKGWTGSGADLSPNVVSMFRTTASGSGPWAAFLPPDFTFSVRSWSPSLSSQDGRTDAGILRGALRRDSKQMRLVSIAVSSTQRRHGIMLLLLCLL